MSRPACVVHCWEVTGEARPRFTHGGGVRSVVRRLADTVGLTHMGVNLRSIEPGDAGTHRHFHTVEEEWVYVLSGVGVVRIGPHRLPVRAGSFVGFPPGPRPHHFLAEGEEALALLEGGERRPAEDQGCYVDLAKWWRNGKFVETTNPLPPEEGDRGQHVHIDDVAEKAFQHDVDPLAHRQMRRLDRPTGLTRQSVVWARVDSGHSTALHTHTLTDEWIFILDGRAAVRVGDAGFEVGPFDFIGHPAGSPAHRMEPLEPLTYLMGGERHADDITIYPEAGVRRVGDRLEPLS